MRAFGWDLLRGGHHAQRPFAPLEQVEHLAAPTNSASIVKKTLAKGAPSTHGAASDLGNGGCDVPVGTILSATLTH